MDTRGTGRPGRRRRDADAAAARLRLERAGAGAPPSTGWVPSPPAAGPPSLAALPSPPPSLGPLPSAPPPLGPLPSAHRPPAQRRGRVGAAIEERLPVGLRAATVSPGPRGLAGLALLVAVAVAVAVGVWWLARPTEQAVPRQKPLGRSLTSPAPAGPGGVGGPASAPGPLSTPGAVTPAAPVMVHVVGAVRRPGLVSVPAGSRVADALAAAGGVTRRADAATVNLARPLVDGEQVVVLRRGQAARPGGAGAAGASTGGGPPGSGVSAPNQPGGVPPGPLDLNTATLDQLDELPGIGPVLAQRILDWRTANGRFSSVEELGEVSGIGEATLADLRPVVTV